MREAQPARDARDQLVVVGGVQVLRFMPDGVLDASFGSGGVVRDIGMSGIGEVALQPDGRIVVGGTQCTPTDDAWCRQDFALARLLADVSPDWSFGNGGLRSIDFGGWAGEAYSAANGVASAVASATSRSAATAPCGRRTTSAAPRRPS